MNRNPRLAARINATVRLVVGLKGRRLILSLPNRLRVTKLRLVNHRLLLFQILLHTSRDDRRRDRSYWLNNFPWTRLPVLHNRNIGRCWGLLVRPTGNSLYPKRRGPGTSQISLPSTNSSGAGLPQEGPRCKDKESKRGPVILLWGDEECRRSRLGSLGSPRKSLLLGASMEHEGLSA